MGRGSYGQIVIQGPKGLTTASRGSLVPALIAAGAVLLGTERDVQAFISGLDTPQTSRTFSYLACMGLDCAAALKAFAQFAASLVVIMGCGGIGSLSALLLAGAGLGKLRIVDGDKIEQSNLNRQLVYGISDVGRPKVEVVAEQLKARFPRTFVESVGIHAAPHTVDQICKGADAILLTADEPLGILRATADHAASASVPLVVAGYNVRSSIVTSSWEQGDTDKQVEWYRAPSSIMPSFGPVNAELAGLATNLLFQLLSGILSGPEAKQAHMFKEHRFPRGYVYCTGAS